MTGTVAIGERNLNLCCIGDYMRGCDKNKRSSGRWDNYFISLPHSYSVLRALIFVQNRKQFRDY